MDFKRIVKHLLMTRWQVSRAFPSHALREIEKSIKASESAHQGEIRFVVEGALEGAILFEGQTARERAIDVFSQLRLWDTEHNNGVLIYLLLADRAVEIIADRGIHSRAGAHEWAPICRKIEADFKRTNYEDGVVNGIDAVAHHLKKHFPASGEKKNALPNVPVVM